MLYKLHIKISCHVNLRHVCETLVSMLGPVPLPHKGCDSFLAKVAHVRHDASI